MWGRWDFSSFWGQLFINWDFMWSILFYWPIFADYPHIQVVFMRYYSMYWSKAFNIFGRMHSQQSPICFGHGYRMCDCNTIYIVWGVFQWMQFVLINMLLIELYLFRCSCSSHRKDTKSGRSWRRHNSSLTQWDESTRITWTCKQVRCHIFLHLYTVKPHCDDLSQ